MLQGDQTGPLADSCQLLKVVQFSEIPRKPNHIRVFTLPCVTSLLSIKTLRLIHAVMCIQFLFAEEYSTVQIYHVVFISLLMNSSVISSFWILWLKFLWTFLYTSFLLGHYGRCLFNFPRNDQFSKVGVSVLHSHQKCKCPSWPHIIINTGITYLF